MPRLSRLVVPGYPHHITQRGVRSMNIFTDDNDRLSYLQFMAEESNRFGVTFECPISKPIFTMSLSNLYTEHVR